MKSKSIKVKPIVVYKLADLLAKCDPKAKRTKEDLQWLNFPTVGKEIKY